MEIEEILGIIKAFFDAIVVVFGKLKDLFSAAQPAEKTE